MRTFFVCCCCWYCLLVSAARSLQSAIGNVPVCIDCHAPPGKLLEIDRMACVFWITQKQMCSIGGCLKTTGESLTEFMTSPGGVCTPCRLCESEKNKMIVYAEIAVWRTIQTEAHANMFVYICTTMSTEWWWGKKACAIPPLHETN